MVRTLRLQVSHAVKHSLFNEPERIQKAKPCVLLLHNLKSKIKQNLNKTSTKPNQRRTKHLMVRLSPWDLVSAFWTSWILAWPPDF